ncbi:hypothetical protein PanWU01x14_108090 [Parasponia andersonii]|uniref:Uncharacterized protein n=1 Tax=Parasponia andersonii TaxID=3476 RepID=A0A2P5D0E7_PARAD|nr:hypothetical protein PanWU01x14_108090 [Parasponia andersonii]
MVDHVELEGHPHEPRELLHSRSYLLHHLLYRPSGRGGGIGVAGGDDGGQAEVWGLVRPGGEGFEEGRPLGAIRVAYVDYVELRLALQGFQYGPIARHVSERGPRADFLELQHHLPR